jgi:aarF domain-containing kinase
MAFFARAISLFPSMQWLSLPDEVSVFGDMMFQQLDLRHEAENLDTFEKNFASRAVPVRFPRPVRDFSTQDILIEEFQDAVPLEDFLHLGGGAFDEALATLGLDAFLVSILLYRHDCT